MTSLDSPTTITLIQRVQRGDPKAQYQLYQQYAKAMYGVCGRFVGAGPLAEELLQDAFVKAFKHIHSYKGAGSFGAWLKQIVIRTALNHLQKKSTHWLPLEIVKEAAQEVPSYETNTAVQRQVADIHQAMQQLADGYRTILQLYIFEGYDHEEIGEILGISPSTSKSQYSRAKKRLNTLLSNTWYETAP